jgi:FkbM family methyltransferase
VKYSQYDEDRYILEAFKGREPGRFLDIGAFDAKVFSNTRALFELGWSGLMVEPAPGPFANLLREYGNEERIRLLNCCVSVSPGIETLRATEDMVSTTSPAHYAKWKDQAKYIGTFLSPALALEDLFVRFGSFEFVNFDTEGTSAALFIEMLALGIYPKCVCVEHDECLESLKQTASEYTCVYENATNGVFVR